MNHEEHHNAAALVRWFDLQYPALRQLFYHVPNERRDAKEASRMHKEGARAGAVDYVFDVACGAYHGLRIELKAPKGRSTAKQKETAEKMRAQGFAAYECKGWTVARDLIVEYLALGTGARLERDQS